MLTFLKIILGSIVLLLIGVLFAWWVFKRWLGKKMGKYLAASEITEPRYALPARLHLEITAEPETAPALDTLWARFHALGFVQLADLIDANGAFSLMRAARHRQMPLALVLIQAHGETGIAEFMLFSISDSNQLHAFGNGPEPAGHTPSMHWTVDAALDPESALHQWQSATADLQLRPIELPLVKAVYERAYATRMDADLMRAPTRAPIEQRAMARKPVADAAAIDEALELSFGYWFEQIERAAIEHYQRSSGVDALRWERMKDRIDVVHDKLRPQEIKTKFNGDEVIGQLIDQLVAQGYQGILLYRKVIERLPANIPRRQQLGEVMRPLRAVLFVSNSDQEAPVTSAATHMYSAVDADGNSVHGAVLANSSSDAIGQLRAMGMSESKILSEPTAIVDLSAVLLDPAAAATAARASREPLAKSLLRAVFSNLWLWGPPLALVAWSLYAGRPHGWGDYLIFAYAGLALLVLVFFTAPMLLYNQLLRARMLGRWSVAETCRWLLQWFWMPGVSKSYLLSEKCKILAGRGKLPQALALWQPREAHDDAESYLIALAAIYDAAGATDEMIEAQRRLLALNPRKETMAIDLAMSLARYQSASDEAEHLISQAPLAGLSELALLGYQFTRGLIAAERGQHSQAIKHYGEALKLSKQYQGNPLVMAFIAEINGFVALSFKRLGETGRATKLWNTVLPLLKTQLGSQYLIRRYMAG